MNNLTAKQKGNILKALISGIITKHDLKDDKIFKVVTSDKPIILFTDEWSENKKFFFNGEQVSEDDYKVYVKLTDALLENKEAWAVIAPYNRETNS